jgi:3-isopropylmalate/(R)-2-methylmalate dehydratase small subunit
MQSPIAAARSGDREGSIGRSVFDVENQEVRVAGLTVKVTVRETARDALVNGRWDAIGELLDGVPAVKTLATKLPYLAA